MESEEKLYRHALYIDNDIENIHFHHFYASINPKMYYDCFNIYNCTCDVTHAIDQDLHHY